jgi:hypothetical protein
VSGGRPASTNNQHSANSVLLGTSISHRTREISEPESTPQTDDEDLKHFFALLEQKKDLNSFSHDSHTARDASMRSTTTAMSQFLYRKPLSGSKYPATKQVSRTDEDDIFMQHDSKNEQERNFSDLDFSEDDGEHQCTSQIQDLRDRQIQKSKSPATYASAQSYLSSKPPVTSYLSRVPMAVASPFSLASFATAPSYLSVGSKGRIRYQKRPVLTAETEHTSRARAAGLLGDNFDALDWSGSGMHIQLPGNDEPSLVLEKEIARTNRAVVSSVLCRRVRLARKTMLCHRRFTTEEAFEEVKHLHRLQHNHVVRLVGSYMQRRYLSILTYPVADLDLGAYLRPSGINIGPSGQPCALVRSFSCLISALSYVHKSGIKHMDIKPKNILVRILFGGSTTRSCTGHRISVLLTDFGISRTIIDESNTETDGPTGRTEMYCSPEVAGGEPRGRSSDIFSLGCVFAEMFTVIAEKTLEDFEEQRTDDGKAFYRNLSLVIDWLDYIVSQQNRRVLMCRLCDIELDAPWTDFGKDLRNSIVRMLSPHKSDRPSAQELQLESQFCEKSCCKAGPQPFCHAEVVD